MKPVDESSIPKERWFGQFCNYQEKQFHSFASDQDEMPSKTFCHYDSRKQCSPKICPLIEQAIQKIKMTVSKDIVIVSLEIK